jgi:integrase
MRKTLTDKGVAALKPRAQRYAYPDPELRGHYVRVQPSGAKSFVAVTLDPHRKQVWATIGGTDVLTVAESREKAREAIKRIKDGKPAFKVPPARPESVEDVAEQWLKRHVRAKGLRSEHEIRRLLRAHVYSAWGGRAFLDIRRSDVAALLDEVEDDHGARQADYVLAIVRGVMNWYATRHDDYVPPIVRGMRRTNPKERQRSRILADDEIRAVWKAAETNGTFGALVRLSLLTAQRREKVVSMRWSDVAMDGAWTIPAEAREKGTAGELGLPKAALDIVQAQPHIGDNPFVLAGRGDGHINGYSKAKRQFDAKLPDMPQWQLHDLRRTARSLMARAGVRPDIAERVMGHAIEGVEGVYDRHAYRDEKADALRRLATLIDAIVHPRSADVLPMAAKRGSANDIAGNVG